MGSSPLARGLPRAGGFGIFTGRIIPARAGFTVRFGLEVLLERDHPRSRGVYGAGDEDDAGGDGIIPARAGFTGVRAPGMPSSRDHPRSRGVYEEDQEPGAARLGSSPLARGLPGIVSGTNWPTRIIPARAGFTRWAPPSCRPGADHPRSRGVYFYDGTRDWTPGGSSPLARGLRAPQAVVERGRRIIPARAGFTYSIRPARCRGGDHPRSRGVYLADENYPADISGSSPLARGLRSCRSTRAAKRGIIPARAGFTGTGRKL